MRLMKALLVLLTFLSGCSYFAPQIKASATAICADVPYQNGFTREYYTPDGFARKFSLEQREHFDSLIKLCPENAEAEKEGKIIGAWMGQLPYVAQATGQDLQKIIAGLPSWALPWVK